MPRDARAYLADVIEACDAIANAVHGLDLAGYESSRLVRSSVEREFIIIGEAVSALSRVAPDVFASITRARRIVDFRNQLTHEYPTVIGVAKMCNWTLTHLSVPAALRTPHVPASTGSAA